MPLLAPVTITVLPVMSGVVIDNIVGTDNKDVNDNIAR
jgi:hypothetical protein